jgi:hypothetical protein
MWSSHRDRTTTIKYKVDIALPSMTDAPTRDFADRQPSMASACAHEERIESKCIFIVCGSIDTSDPYLELFLHHNNSIDLELTG